MATPLLLRLPAALVVGPLQEAQSSDDDREGRDAEPRLSIVGSGDQEGAAHGAGVRVADEAVAPLLQLQQEALRPRVFDTGENAVEAGPDQMEVVKARAILMTKRYAMSAFSFVTFLLWMVSPIVKPGPTVPLTVFAEAAEPLPAPASAAAATALSSGDACE